MFDKTDFQAMRSSIYTELDNLGGVNGDSDLYETIRIEEGSPAFGNELTAKTIPLEANLKAAISFTKGCFPGQEVVARINNLGHPAKVLVGLSMPETGDNLIGSPMIVEGKSVGTITSTCYSPALRIPLALATVKWKFREVGQSFEISENSGITAVVIQIPIAGLED